MATISVHIKKKIKEKKTNKQKLTTTTTKIYPFYIFLGFPFFSNFTSSLECKFLVFGQQHMTQHSVQVNIVPFLMWQDSSTSPLDPCSPDQNIYPNHGSKENFNNIFMSCSVIKIIRMVNLKELWRTSLIASLQPDNPLLEHSWLSGSLS